jgi:thymidylate synthase
MIRKGIRFDYGDYHDIVERAREDKGSRQLYLSIWHPEDQSNGNGRVPCTLGYFFLIRNHTLDVTYHIRSCDILRHFRNDIYMAVRLAQDFRDKVDPTINLGKLNMWVGSLHCFINEKEILKKYTK